ncbi:MAG: internal scaffolding protein [Arizlama microvirus]|nr:MAG: internal scaffolding protein [Arizlama microvirus]
MRNKVYGFFNPGRCPGTIFTEPSKTQQQYKNEVNINTIMEKARKGRPVMVQSRQAFYEDFTGVQDFKAAQDRIIAVSNEFDQLPAKIRLKFNNNPAEFYEFMHDEKNINEAEALGLIEKKEITEIPEPPKPTEKEVKSTLPS